MKSNRIRKLLVRSILCVLIFTMLIPVVGVTAVSEKDDEIGYESYTYWYNFTGTTRRIVPTKPMYETGAVFTNMDLGCSSSSKIYDSHVSNVTGITYILDGGDSRVILLDPDYSINSSFNYVYNEEGERFYFNGAKGIFIDKDENVYIADTSNARVIKCDATGKLIRNYVLPASHLIPSNFNYSPIKVAVDHKGYVYILSSGSYYGAILYSPEDVFLGFYGSNDVPATFTQALTTLWNRLFMTNKKRSTMQRTLPYTFSDLWVDEKGFIYTVTGNTATGNKTGQIKRLNPGGSNVLKESDATSFIDEGLGMDPIQKKPRNQNLIGIAADENGFMYTVDETYGRIFVYDKECTMISAFGGGIKNGTQDGTFYIPSSIAYNKFNQDVVITDSSQNTVTVFNITEYGALIKEAQAKTVVGDYEEAIEEWTEVLANDRNCQMAYAGLAKAYYVMGETCDDEKLAEEYNDKAIKLAKQGYDRETYSLAFAAVRDQWLKDNFTIVLVGAIILIAGLLALLVYSTKKKFRLVKNEKIHLATTMMTRPLANFHELKEKNLTSVPICLVIIVLYYVFDVMSTTMGGFAFVYFDPSSYNALLILAKTAGLVILWTVVNWAVCTLFGGKGKIKEILSVISYSLIPLLLGSLVYIVASNLLVPDEATFLNVLSVILTLYMIIMLCFGTMIIHDYTFMKFVGTTLLTLLGCAIVIFLLIAVTVLVQQVGGFIGTLYSEILKLF